jgi:hypothetical protein
MTDADKIALERSLAVAMKKPGRAQQIQAKLKEEPRLAVMKFAASLCQDEALRLRPNQLPPCEIDPDDIDAILERGDCDDVSAVYGAALLLRRMIKAGISRWHPDPVAALRDRAGNGRECGREALAP